MIHRLAKNEYGVMVPCDRCMNNGPMERPCALAAIRLAMVVLKLQEDGINFRQMGKAQKWKLISSKIRELKKTTTSSDPSAQECRTSTLHLYSRPEKGESMSSVVKIGKKQQAKLEDMAQEWAEIWEEEREIHARRALLGEKLLKAMHKAGVDHVLLPGAGKKVQHVISKYKDPGKGQLVDFFGEKKAEKFWKWLPDKTSSYLTVANVSQAE